MYHTRRRHSHRLPSLAGGRRGCGDGVGGPGAEAGLKARAVTEKELETVWKKGGGGRKEVSARPGWHQNPPHVVDLMEGCRSLIRRTGDELGRDPRPSTSFTFQPRGSLATTLSGTAPDHRRMAGWNASPETDLLPKGGCTLALSQHLGLCW